MDYISKLTETDVKELCELIGGNAFKCYFRKNPNPFHKIKKGFEPSKMAEKQALKVAIANIGTPFVSSFVNGLVTDEVERLGTVDFKAVNNTFLELLGGSLFKNNITLLAKIIDADVEESLLSEYQEKLNHNAASTETEINIDDAEKKVAELTSQLDELNAKYNSSIASCEEQKKTISEYRMKIQSLEERISMADHPDAQGDNYDEEFPYRSLCIIPEESDYGNKAYRIADLLGEEIQSSTEYFKDWPRIDHIYLRTIDKPVGFVGIWDWNRKPNNRDSSKDYIVSNYNSFLLPIEIIVLENCNSMEDVIKSLRSGVVSSACAARYFFAFLNRNSKKYEGLLCDFSSLNVTDKTFRISDNVFRLPKYSIAVYKVFEYGKRKFCTSLNLGVPDDLIGVRDGFEYVRDVILKRVTWSAFKQKGVVRSSYNEIKDFLSNLPLADLYDEISSALGCKQEVAEDLVSDFVDIANRYISAGDLEGYVFSEIALRHDELRNECEKSISSEWERNNSQKLRKANEELTTIANECENKKNELDSINRDYLAIKAQYESMCEQLRQREELGQAVESSVNKRIENARKNAADFIAEQLFIGSGAKPIMISEADNASAGWHLGERIDDEQSEYHDWKELIAGIETELYEAGVVEPNLAYYLSSFIYVAYLCRTPLLLSGPSASNIVDAFSAALFGKTAASIDCANDNLTVEKLAETFKNENVIIFHNPFNPSFERLLSSFNDKFVVAVNPYAEDLLIEPKGLINYFVPVLTEPFVTDNAACNFIGGVPSSDFKDYELSSGKLSHAGYIQSLRVSQLAQKKLGKLIAAMHGVIQGNTIDADYLTLLLPCSFVTNNLNKLEEYLEKKPVSSDVKKILELYLGSEE